MQLHLHCNRFFFTLFAKSQILEPAGKLCQQLANQGQIQITPGYSKSIISYNTQDNIVIHFVEQIY